LVVPANNETKRLPPMLDEAFAYLTSRTQKDPSFTYEILIVDDGSKDGTAQFALEYAKKHNNAHVHVVTLTLNRGKGGAVKHGMVHAAGKLILFLDADGASKMSEVEQLEAAVKKLSGDSKVSEVAAVAIGSRASLVPDTLVRRSFLRNTLMFCFHLIVHMIGVQGIADTQCGFKLFTRQAAREIFPNMHVEGWIFDIEILMLAQFFKIPIKECAIVWEEIDGSKVNIIVDSLRMLKDLVIIRLNYMLGSWQAESWSSKAKKRS
jgi:dolichyl-phosphate beta-glucosyltransferase